MNICIPVKHDKGLQSEVFAHFGSAPIFLIVDTETRSCRAVTNTRRQHPRGSGGPVAALLGEKLDGVVVGGVGTGALAKLHEASIPVHRAGRVTVEEALEERAAGRLEEITPETARRLDRQGPHGHGHGHGHGCGHGEHRQQRRQQCRQRAAQQVSR